MKKIFSNESIVTVNHLCNLLRAEGIPAVVRNDRLMGVLGEVPYVECWPQLWVVNHGDAGRAERLIDQALRDPGDADRPWRCVRCGERSEGQFAACWNCGAEAPE